MRGRYGVVFARFRLLGRHDMARAAVASARVWGMHVSYWHQRLKASTLFNGWKAIEVYQDCDSSCGCFVGRRTQIVQLEA
jgi:hypothetical protein